MTDAITATNITAAAIVTHAGLAGIMFVGAVRLLWSGEGDSYRTERSPTGLAWVILPLFLIGLAALLLSSDYSAIWRPVFGYANPPVLPTGTAVLMMFACDILLISILVGTTGGSRESPFQALYFVIPALAIFLREPFWRVTSYTIAVIALFRIQLSSVPRHPSDLEARAERMAYAWVSVLGVSLTTLVGYVTRPR